MKICLHISLLEDIVIDRVVATSQTLVRTRVLCKDAPLECHDGEMGGTLPIFDIPVLLVHFAGRIQRKLYSLLISLLLFIVSNLSSTVYWY